MEQEESGAPPVPITVRQLEAIVRISESLARMGLQTVAGAAHVQQALELFQVSTMNAVNAGLTSDLGLSEDMVSGWGCVEWWLGSRI
jgi:DNA replication licensing factor MCM5